MDLRSEGRTWGLTIDVLVEVDVKAVEVKVKVGGGVM